jgi:hypothetical protein
MWLQKSWELRASLVLHARRKTRMMRYRVFARRARAILTERDYAAALAILRAAAATASQCEEEERIEALLRELTCYDLQNGEAGRPTTQTPQPTRPRVNGRVHPAELGRRWSDPRT